MRHTLIMPTAQTKSDWVLYSLLGLLGVMLILVIKQVNRQWSIIDVMHNSLVSQADSLKALQTKISNTSRATNKVTESAKSIAAEVFKRGLASSRLPDYAAGDWCVDAFFNSIRTITPLVSIDLYAANVQNYVLEPLIVLNPDTLQWQGLIAKSWQTSEDGLTITFELRDDVSFSDGVPLTAEDVLFSYDFAMTEAIQAPSTRGYLDKVKQVQALDKSHVQYTFKEPYFQALATAGNLLPVLPKHFYQPYLNQPQTFNQSKGLLMGSGPYKLVDPKNWTPDQGHIELVRNDNYWGDVQPSFSRILWKIIVNDSARLTAFRNGDIDFYLAVPAEYQALTEDKQLVSKSRYFAYLNATKGYRYIAWNQQINGKPSRFADQRVRLAMTYLTDVKRIIDDVFYGHAVQAIGPFFSTSKQHDPSLQPYPYNLERAKTLLKAAGYEDRDHDGVIEDSAGQPFEFKLLFLQSKEEYKRYVLLLKDLYAKAGIKMIPFALEWPVLLERVTKKDFDAYTMGWTSDIEADLYQTFHSSQALNNGDNFINYQNPELDKLIEQARRTVAEQPRMALWQAAERIIYEDQPYTFLFSALDLLLVDQRIANVQTTTLGVNLANQSGLNLGPLMLETYVPKARQKYAQ